MFLTIQFDVSLWYFVDVLYDVGKATSVPSLLRVIMNRYGILSDVFSASTGVIFLFLPIDVIDG